ncbi:tRNA-specific 2-thiouridylase MnmA [Buchnera aphidicola (Eriosoma grossulariae)]|uniref:tRNA 2-thiouridine(34) synthase MnmA n=1 Tax=Buchnera aphidicola TaxID=9 RepID=UPI003463855F
MLINKKNKVIVAMSGGVDSSVSAWLLQQQNYQVEGLFMKNWEENDNKQYCSSKKDLEDAQRVCDQLGLYLHTINFSIEYWEKVFLNFINEYKRGTTPNPDILCNKEIKFKLFLDFAITELGSDFIATGHYVRKKNIDNQEILLRGIDKTKDQSYFLYTLNQYQLKKSLFPLGELKKQSVREIAHKLNMSIANKKDSTGICFIEPKNFQNFLSRYFNIVKGKIITVYKEVIGIHSGLIYYTLGQRKGLKIGGLKNKKKLPWYVVDKIIHLNLLIVAQGKNNPYLMSIGLIVKNLHWINKNYFFKKNMICRIQIRHLQSAVLCQLIPIDDKYIKVLFQSPISSVTPGQSAVFYFSNICLGGGVISSRLPYVSLYI